MFKGVNEFGIEYEFGNEVQMAVGNATVFKVKGEKVGQKDRKQVGFSFFEYFVDGGKKFRSALIG